MNLRNFLVAAGLFAIVPACTTQGINDEASTGSSSKIVAAPDSIAVVEGTIGAGNAITVHYEPGEYPGLERGELPYVAVRLKATEDMAPVSIEVNGDFPGEPRVIVVDDDLKVVAQTVGAKLPNGTVHASLRVPAEARPSMVMVRDDIWVRPMPFTIGLE